MVSHQKMSEAFRSEAVGVQVYIHKLINVVRIAVVFVVDVIVDCGLLVVSVVGPPKAQV